MNIMCQRQQNVENMNGNQKYDFRSCFLHFAAFGTLCSLLYSGISIVVYFHNQKRNGNQNRANAAVRLEEPILEEVKVDSLCVDYCNNTIQKHNILLKFQKNRIKHVNALTCKSCRGAFEASL